MNILYVCTHNRCRSIICEAITNQLGEGRLTAFSAGSEPAGEVHPLSLHYLGEAGYPTDGLRSQSWDTFDDIPLDLVLTVCDSAAGEACPLWMGKSLKLHWALADPSQYQGSEADIAAAFRATIAEVEARVRALLAVPVDELDQAGLKAALEQLGAV